MKTPGYPGLLARIFPTAIFAVLWSLTTAQLWAGETDVVNAKARCTQRVCTISATVRHDDTGWDHFADHWRVLTPADEEIARRVLHHPHENEQPFTRSLSGVRIPPGIDRVLIEAHDSVHEYGGQRFTLQLP
jgi:hypothetical protein